MDAESGFGGAIRTFVQPESGRVAAFGEARGTGIHEKNVLEILFEFPDVRVAIEVGVDRDSVQFRIAGRQGV